MQYFVIAALFASAFAVPNAESLLARQAAKAGGDPQKSLTLDPKVIAKGFAIDGVGQPNGIDPKTNLPNPPFDGPPSLKSTNNFINFCVGKTITDGKQLKGGSCNPCPIGDIPNFNTMPSAKFLFPKNMDMNAAAPNAAFTVKLNVQKMKTGVIANSQTNFMAAPQQLSNGQISGNVGLTIEELDTLQQTKPTDPVKFSFFKGLNAPAKNGVLTADITGGLPAGVYRACSLLRAANDQPVIVPVAQHGGLDDCIYFGIGQGNAGGAAAGAAAGGAAAGGAAAGGAAAGAGAAKGAGAAAGGKGNRGGRN